MSEVSGSPVEPKGQGYDRRLPAALLVSAFLVTLLDSQSFPSLNVLWLFVYQRFYQVGPGHTFPAYAALLLHFADVLVAVGTFYLIGWRVDFKRYKMLAGLSFAGALAASALGYLLATTESGGGIYWGTGFGFVTSLNVAEPSGMLDILASAVASFMFPVAGYVIGQFRRAQAGVSEAVTVAPLGARRTPILPFVVAGLVITAAALPLSNLVHQFLTASRPEVVITNPGPWPGLAAGYVGFLIYPVLLMLTFFFLGRNRSGGIDLRRLGGPILAAGMVGPLAGLLLSLYPTYAAGYPVFTPTRMVELLPSAVVDGVFVFLLGLASASLGVLSRGGFESKPRSWIGRGYRPIFLVVLTITLVSLAAVAAVSYASAVPSYSCIYQPGNALYFRVESDQGGAPIAGLDVSGKLVSLCPVVFACTGQCNPAFQTSTITTLGEWNFVTNSSGYVTVPSSMLGGSAFWFTLASTGHTYVARYQICGGGVTSGQLSLPSGAVSGKEMPADNNVISSSILQNGTQVVSGCGPTTFSGNATIT